MDNRQVFTAAAIVVLALGLSTGHRQDVQNDQARKPPAIMHDGLKISVTNPKPEEGKPLTATITVENTADKECTMKLPVHLSTISGEPMGRRGPVPVQVRTESIDVNLKGKEKKTYDVKLADSWKPAKQSGEADGNEVAESTSITYLLAIDRGEKKGQLSIMRFNPDRPADLTAYAGVQRRALTK